MMNLTTLQTRLDNAGVKDRRGEKGGRVYIELRTQKPCIVCGAKPWLRAPVEEIRQFLTEGGKPDFVFADMPKWRVREFTSGLHRDCERILEGRPAKR